MVPVTVDNNVFFYFSVAPILQLPVINIRTEFVKFE